MNSLTRSVCPSGTVPLQLERQFPEKISIMILDDISRYCHKEADVQDIVLNMKGSAQRGTWETVARIHETRLKSISDGFHKAL